MPATDILPPIEIIQTGDNVPENGMSEMLGSTEVLEAKLAQGSDSTIETMAISYLEDVLESTEKLDDIQHTRVQQEITVFQVYDDFKIIVNIMSYIL